MNKDQAMYAYHKAGLGMEEGKRAWKKSKITLYDAYELDADGKVKIKMSRINPSDANSPTFYDLIRPKMTTGVGIENAAGEKESRKIETRVHGIIRERSSVVNGVLSEAGGSAFSQNYVGALAL